MLTAMFLFTTANTVVKYIGELSISPIQIVFFRNLIPLMGLLAYFTVASRSTVHLTPRIIRDFGPRSIFSSAGLSCLFYAYMHGNLSDVTAISFTSPLFISILAIPMLREHLTWHKVLGLVMGFCGVLVITQPTGNVDNWPAIGAVVCACSGAYLMVTDRKLRHHYTGIEIVFFFSLGCTLVTLLPTVILWKTPTLTEWVCLIIIGVLGGLAQLCIALAYRRATATVVAQVAYVSVVIAAVYNYALFNVLPTMYLALGSLLITGGGIYIVYHKKRNQP